MIKKETNFIERKAKMVKINTDVIIVNQFSMWTIRTENSVWETFNTLKEACDICDACDVTYQIID
jgi:hypothetical protein